jgi:hypothetical protein
MSDVMFAAFMQMVVTGEPYLPCNIQEVAADSAFVIENTVSLSLLVDFFSLIKELCTS